jgi:Ca2+-binding RTX toxin-like protein
MSWTIGQAIAFLNNAASAEPAIAGADGVNHIDSWMGGLAEVHVMGGLLGETFNILFVDQIGRLKDGDRMYYLYRLVNQNFGDEIATEQFKDIVERNTGLQHLNGNIFAYADQYYDLKRDGDLTTAGVQNDIADHAYGAALDAHPTAGILSRGGSDASNGVVLSYIAPQLASYSRQNVSIDGRTVSYDTATGTLAHYILDQRPELDPSQVSLEGTPVTGAGSHEVMIGTDRNDILYMEGGDDTAYGEAGDDLLFGGSGIDRLYGGDGNDTLLGGDGGDLMDGGDCDDVLVGGGSGTAAAGLNQLVGGQGDDVIYAGQGIDKISGGGGDDVIYGQGDTDPFTHGGDGNDYIDGGVSGDLLYGDNGDDVLVGGNDQDVLMGGDGDDTITGGGGNDSIVGGNGADVAVYSGARENYTISRVSDDVYRVVDNRGGLGPDGDDTITGIELLRFSDADFAPSDANTGIVYDGNSAPDIRVGTVGDDVLRGFGGNDSLFDSLLHIKLMRKPIV